MRRGAHARGNRTMNLTFDPHCENRRSHADFSRRRSRGDSPTSENRDAYPSFGRKCDNDNNAQRARDDSRGLFPLRRYPTAGLPCYLSVAVETSLGLGNSYVRTSVRSDACAASAKPGTMPGYFTVRSRELRELATRDR